MTSVQKSNMRVHVQRASSLDNCKKSKITKRQDADWSIETLAANSKQLVLMNGTYL